EVGGPICWVNPVPGGQTPIGERDARSFVGATARCPTAGILPAASVLPLRQQIPTGRRAGRSETFVSEMISCQAKPTSGAPSPARLLFHFPSPAAHARIALFPASWQKTSKTIQTLPGSRLWSRLSHRHPQGRIRRRSGASLPPHRQCSTRPAARFLPPAGPPIDSVSGVAHRTHFYPAKTSCLFSNIMPRLYKTKPVITLHVSRQHPLIQTSSLSRIRHARILNAFVESPRCLANRLRPSILARCSPR